MSLTQKSTREYCTFKKLIKKNTTACSNSDKMVLLRCCMSLFVSSLNSGSNGNCYYIGNNDEAILVDGGISCRETEKRLKRLGLNIKKIKGIFVTHEHGDHIHGIPALSRKHQLPVYITPRTQQFGNLDLRKELMIPFRAYEPIRVGSLTVTAFPMHHDASDPHNFVIAHDNVSVGIFTDIGFACEHVTKHFSQCHAAFLETNYDEDLLANGGYSMFLKDRIRGGKGHLSNKQALELFVRHKPSFMSHLFLSHLSEENNCPSIVEELFARVGGKTEVIVTSRHRETDIYQIQNTSCLSVKRIKSHRTHSPLQLSLF